MTKEISLYANVRKEERRVSKQKKSIKREKKIIYKYITNNLELKILVANQVPFIEHMKKRKQERGKEKQRSESIPK